MSRNGPHVLAIFAKNIINMSIIYDTTNLTFVCTMFFLWSLISVIICRMLILPVLFISSVRMCRAMYVPVRPIPALVKQITISVYTAVCVPVRPIPALVKQITISVYTAVCVPVRPIPALVKQITISVYTVCPSSSNPSTGKTNYNISLYSMSQFVQSQHW